MGGHDHHHLHDRYGPEARYAVEREAELPTTKWEEEVARGLELGLPGDSIVDKRIHRAALTPRRPGLHYGWPGHVQG